MYMERRHGERSASVVHEPGHHHHHHHHRSHHRSHHQTEGSSSRGYNDTGSAYASSYTSQTPYTGTSVTGSQPTIYYDDNGQAIPAIMPAGFYGWDERAAMGQGGYGQGAAAGASAGQTVSTTESSRTPTQGHHGHGHHSSHGHRSHGHHSHGHHSHGHHSNSSSSRPSGHTSNTQNTSSTQGNTDDGPVQWWWESTPGSNRQYLQLRPKPHDAHKPSRKH
ncbi:uncharacterized protein F4822DRAFT_358552 [Hypoxylon trugodes]|uniref:uncharacterized protein n=1 Tax=Hypoxylon trugodes TaxID=326681 RepID=UPI00219384C9|nr:uncharacterized protein F4822DRAFT_358552 [Hypoxylon trugodes]KAI1385953.1 hypothetical protein F4822DRAFT_358552 [Hypoxylon trugodes]